jgi:hypothetical protein
MAFDLSQYETVDQRIEKFWDKYEDGAIITEIVKELASDDRAVFKCYLYKVYLDDKPFATGYADETRGSSHINKTSFMENCESSAIGRALHNGGISKHSEGKPRPSRSEMEKVARLTNDKASEAIANAPLAINNTWDEFVGKEPTPEPVSLEEAAQLVQQTFGEAEPIPTCSHGVRTIKSGVSASGKAWQGAMCEVRGASKGDRCPAIWYVMSKTTGKWRLPEGVE